jgi:hypothetical protein
VSSTQQVRNGKKPNATDTVQKTETKRKSKVTPAPKKPETTEEVKPISKYQEWKLLYAPHPLSSADDGTSPMRGSTSRSGAQETDSGKLKGLCRNCKKQKICKLPKPDGGVWRCEDYE